MLKNVLVVAGLAVAFFGNVPASASATRSFEREVDAFIAPLVATKNFGGVILVAKGDQIVFSKGYGHANLEHRVANQPSTIFHIASVSKPFTAAAIMRLAEQKKLDLGAPLSAVLPDYPNGEGLTIHHLLSHTSGIPNINDFDEYAAIQRRPNRPQDLIALFKDKPLEFSPGSRYSYSNSNFNLLAHIIEKVMGEPFATAMERLVFDPLRLRHTGHPRSAADVISGIASGYAPKGSLGLERAAYLDWSVKTGNGSLYSDAEGVMRFMRGVHQGKLLAPASLAASFTPHTPNVGYGWFLTTANKREIHHINGRSPGFAAQADYYVADGVTVVVLSNIYVSVTTDIARAVGGLHFREPVKSMPALNSRTVSASSVAALSGTYQFGPDYYVPNAKIRVQANDGQLAAVVEDGDPYALVPIDATRFLLRSFWVTADFTLGADGKASELAIDGLKGRRISSSESAIADN